MLHIDDLKVIHESKKIVTRMENWPNKTYGRLFENQLGKIKNYGGNIHEFLGTNLDFVAPGDVNIPMIPYIEETMK